MVTEEIFIPDRYRPHPDITVAFEHNDGLIHTLDFTPLLEQYDQDWQNGMLDLATNHARQVPMTPSVSSRRELGDTSDMPIHTLSGLELHTLAPWTMELAKNPRLVSLAAYILKERVWPPDLDDSENDRFRVIMNALYPGEPYEPHVDTNGVTWIIQGSDHPLEDGIIGEGTTVLSSNPEKRGFFIPDLRTDVVLDSVAGRGVLLHAHNMPHYITAPENVRPSLVIELYNDAANEQQRPTTHSQDMGWWDE